MIWVSNDDVVEDFDFEKLTGSNEVSGNFDVRFRWSWITARVRMLCGASIYVRAPLEKLQAGGLPARSLARFT